MSEERKRELERTLRSYGNRITFEREITIRQGLFRKVVSREILTCQGELPPEIASMLTSTSNGVSFRVVNQLTDDR